MGKTCPSLCNYVDTKCLSKQHPICQEDLVALQVPSHIGWVCFLDCLTHYLVARSGTHHSTTTSYLSVSFIHELYFSGQPSHRTIVLLCRQVEDASTRLFQCGTDCLKFPVAFLGTSCLSQHHCCSPPTYIHGALSLLWLAPTDSL